MKNISPRALRIMTAINAIRTFSPTADQSILLELLCDELNEEMLKTTEHELKVVAVVGIKRWKYALRAA